MATMTLEQEQAAFEAALPKLLQENPGKYVLQKEGAIVGIFDEYGLAYQAGIDKFGLETTFLVAKVEEQRADPISYAWNGGVMFG